MRAGNPITSAVGPATDTYTFPPTSNRLSGINLSTGGTRAYTYDGAGNVLTDSRGAGYAYTYDAAGRMATMSINGVLQGSYRYDFAGRQAIRTIASTGVTIHSVFDAQGRRIAEYNEATGALIREYFWLGWEPIAVIEGGITSFVRTDHIGRPVFATNTSGVKVWTATYDPFGGVRTTTGTPISARFPGQWFQSESGLHQNWMRDYDPTTGRYLQADPLGLVDGASVYGYAMQSPMTYTDPTGLSSGRPQSTAPSGSSSDGDLLQCSTKEFCFLEDDEPIDNALGSGFPGRICSYYCPALGKGFKKTQIGTQPCPQRAIGYGPDPVPDWRDRLRGIPPFIGPFVPFGRRPGGGGGRGIGPAIPFAPPFLAKY